jgi:hypothetical protein
LKFQTNKNVTALTTDNDGRIYSSTPYPRGLPKDSYARSNSFPVVGSPHTLRWMEQPPANVVAGTPFNATVGVSSYL